MQLPLLNRLRLTSPFQRFYWFKWIMVVASVVLAAYIGLFASRGRMFGRSSLEIYLLGLFFLIALALMLYRIELGVLAIVFSSFFIRFSFSTGSATQVPVSLLVSGIVVTLWVVAMLMRGRVQLAPGAYVLPTLLFILVSLLSVPYSWLLFRPDIFGHGG
ncbi:MAG TPA: hypothetical protein VFD70_08200, partial [Anaerolineae bacterium]|nr:hypothetical protein [Anaerolineae bacterium]